MNYYQIPITNTALQDVSIIASAYCLEEKMHPISVLKTIFDHIKSLFQLHNNSISLQNYAEIVFGRDNIDTCINSEDPALADMIWSLSIALFYLSRDYNYELTNLSVVLNIHHGWEYLACSGRHLCYTEPNIIASVIENFIKNH